MLSRVVCKALSAYLFVFCIPVFLVLLLALYYQFLANPASHPQPHSSLAFLYTLLICLALAGFLRLVSGRAPGTIYRREGLALVVIIWFVSALIGAMPFFFSGTLINPLDAYFEAMSGLTTTGASVMQAKEYDAVTGKEVPIVQTIGLEPSTTYRFYGTIAPVRNKKTGAVELTGVEAVSRAVLFWRSFLQWIGGMGIVVLFLAVLPALGVGGKVLYQAEVTGPIKESLTPRIRDTASLLWKLYLGLSAIQVILLLLTNRHMPIFDAICIGFSTISTGGFSVRNASIGAYNNVATEWVVIVFMLLGSINFIHYRHILKRKLMRLWEPEMRTYGVWLIIVCLIVSLSLVGTSKQLLTSATTEGKFSWGASFRYGIFQLVSCQTSTGFATANFNLWPFVAQVLLLTSMYIGGMSGSTAGGVKIIRHNILLRLVALRIEALFRPQAVRAVRVGQSEVDTGRALTVLSFFFIVIALTLIGTFLMVVDGIDPETALSVNACCQNNVGLAFRMAGPESSFAFMPAFSTGLSILYMVAGRLEYFAVLIFLLPTFWRVR